MSPLLTCQSVVVKPLAFAVLLAMSGCTLGPSYERPEVNTGVAYQALNGWQVAGQVPAVAENWWLLYQAPELNQLMQQLDQQNLSLQAAEAAWREARALVGGSRAQLYPSVDGRVNASRSSRNEAVSESKEVALGLSWQLDLWGKIRRQVEASTANLQASAADWAAIKLSLRTELAQNYLNLHITDQQLGLYQQTLDSYRRALTMTEKRYQAGLVTKADVSQALTQLNNAKAQQLELSWQRNRYQNAIARLVGLPPSAVQLAPQLHRLAVPEVPKELPANLLQRRPDIAVAEARVKAANAEIGVAQAAYFPDLTLSASLGYQSESLAHWISTPNRVWSLGPAFAMALFDAGTRKAKVEQAEARYDQVVANYRLAVLNALVEVEDLLGQINMLRASLVVQREAHAAAKETLRINTNQYNAGLVDYLSVSTAQTALLNSERNLLSNEANYLTALAQLMSALGGGWQTVNQ